MNNADELLKSLGKTLGIAIEKLIEWYTARAFADGIGYALLATVFLVGLVFGIRFLVKHLDDPAYEDSLIFTGWISFFAAVLGTWMTSFALSALLAPQAYAVDEIMKAIKH